MPYHCKVEKTFFDAIRIGAVSALERKKDSFLPSSSPQVSTAP